MKIKLERRDVYIREFWTMSFVDRYIYTVANSWHDCKSPEKNPLKMSIYELMRWVFFIIGLVLLPFYGVANAIWLKKRPMPDCKDREFNGSKNWRVSNRLVVVRQ